MSMRRFIGAAVFSAGLVLAGGVQAETIGERAGVDRDFINCETGTEYEKIACRTVGSYIGNVLKNSSIGYRDGDLMYRLTPVLPSGRIDGSSCTHQTWLDSSSADIKLRTSGSFSLTGDSISEPVVLAVDLPVHVQAELGMRDRHAFRLPFTRLCTPIWGDRYSITASFDTVSSNLVLFSLEPWVGTLEDGELAVVIRPELAVFSQIAEADPNFKVRNRANLLGAVSYFVLSVPSFVTSVLESPFTGNGLGSAFTTLALDLGVGFVSTGLFLNDAIAVTGYNVIDSVIDGYLSRQLEDTVNGSLDNITRALENSLQETIAGTLGLDANGEKVFVLVPSAGGNSMAEGAIAATEDEHVEAGRAYPVDQGGGVVEFYANGSHDFIGRHIEGKPEIRNSVALLETAPGYYEFAPREWYGTCRNHFDAGRATSNWLGKVTFKGPEAITCGNYTHTKLIHVTETARYAYSNMRDGADVTTLGVSGTAVEVLEHD